LPFTDHAPLSRLFHPSLQHGGFHVSEPWQATLFLLRSEVDGFLPVPLDLAYLNLADVDAMAYARFAP
jgi:hypothetical protein